MLLITTIHKEDKYWTKEYREDKEWISFRTSTKEGVERNIKIQKRNIVAIIGMDLVNLPEE